MYHVSVKTDSGSEPVTQAEITNYIKYDETDATEIALILSMAKSAREIIEKYLNVSLKSKTYVLEFDHHAMDDEYTINLPFGPFVSLTSIVSSDGTTSTTLTTDDYTLKGSQFKELYIPALSDDLYYTVEFISGYGGSGVETIPAVLKNAILKQTLVWYERTNNGYLDTEVLGMINAYSHTTWI